jgi:hypothetical protein
MCINGNVMLIDFWASMVRALPEGQSRTGRDLQQLYHDQGFTILGVSLDRDSDSWMKAIADDQLTWPQISDLKYWEILKEQSFMASLPFRTRC